MDTKSENTNIKASELRLGNLVYAKVKSSFDLESKYELLPCVVRWIKDDRLVVDPLGLSVHYHNQDVLIANVRPIDLSEGWLVEIGFNESSRYGSTISYINDNADFVIEWDDKGGYHSNESWIHLPNVHTLQNAYFVLMKKELTLPIIEPKVKQN